MSAPSHMKATPQWVEWAGDSPDGPFPPDTRLHLRFRAGDEHAGCRAGDYSWRNRGEPDDIVAFVAPVGPKATPGDALPALPEPFHKEKSGFGWPDLYNADQMREYARASIAAAGALPEPLGYMSPEHVEHLRSREHLRGRNYNIKATVFLDHGLSATVPVFAAPSIAAPSPILVEALRDLIDAVQYRPVGNALHKARAALAAIKEQK